MSLLDLMRPTAPANPWLPRQYARPGRITREQWQNDLDRTLLSLEPWVQEYPAALFAQSAPGPLVLKYEALQAFGRERGWTL